jgi:hypothetical protein
VRLASAPAHVLVAAIRLALLGRERAPVVVNWKNVLPCERVSYWAVFG